MAEQHGSIVAYGEPGSLPDEIADAAGKTQRPLARDLEEVGLVVLKHELLPEQRVSDRDAALYRDAVDPHGLPAPVDAHHVLAAGLPDHVEVPALGLHREAAEALVVLSLARREVAQQEIVRFPGRAVARELGTANLVPELRSCFTVGSHFSFYQVEGLIRGGGDYIVGDATIELARLAAKTLPGQILFGEFDRPSSEHGASIDAPGFMMNVQQRLDDMGGADLDHGRVDNIRCYLTGVPGEGDRFLINKYDIVDKHGFHHAAYNAKINIYRGDEPPIFLGAQTEDLADFGTNRRYESIPAVPAPWDQPR